MSEQEPVLVSTATLAWPTRQSTQESPQAVEATLPEVATEEPATTEPKYKVVTLGTPLTAADRDARYFSLQLPSNFVFYPFKHLTASLITGVQQMKFSKASAEDSTRYTVEAVTSALGDGVNAADLTLRDFFYVMYWLRLASYTKFDFNHVAVCRNPEHMEKIVKKTLPPSSLKSVFVLKHTELREKQFQPFEVDEAIRESGLQVGPARMHDVITMSEYDPGTKEAPNPLWDEIVFYGDLASYLTPVQTHPKWDATGKQEPMTLEQRMDLVKKMSGDLIRALKEYRTKIDDYGVSEFINVKCKGCGAVVRTEVRISASDFL